MSSESVNQRNLISVIVKVVTSFRKQCWKSRDAKDTTTLYQYMTVFIRHDIQWLLNYWINDACWDVKCQAENNMTFHINLDYASCISTECWLECPLMPMYVIFNCI